MTRLSPDGRHLALDGRAATLSFLPPREAFLAVHETIPGVRLNSKLLRAWPAIAYDSTPSSFIRRIRVRREMPSIEAALLRFPPVASSVLRIA